MDDETEGDFLRVRQRGGSRNAIARPKQARHLFGDRCWMVGERECQFAEDTNQASAGRLTPSDNGSAEIVRHLDDTGKNFAGRLSKAFAEKRVTILCAS
jgi:hypothetical protein